MNASLPLSASSSAATAAPTSPALMPITARPEAVMVRGRGSYLWDDSGKQYLDFIQGWAVNALGHCPQEIVDAITQQANTLISPSPALHNRPQLELATLLTSLSDMAQVHFANSGAEANEAAIKLARKWGQKHRNGAYEVISTTNAFHGRTLAMMSASGKPGWDTLFTPMPTGFKKVPFGDASAMANAVNSQTVAIMVEPVQGEAGVIVPPEGYLQALRDIADAAGVLLIADEVQTGLARTGPLFASIGAGVAPDIMTLGKGLGGGVPVSAMLAKSHVCCFEHGDQGGTFNGTPLMTAVALAVTKTVSDSAFLEQVQAAGAALKVALQGVSDETGQGAIRGSGLLQAMHIPSGEAAAITAAAFERGLLVNAPRPDTLRFMPSLRVSVAEIEAACETLADAIVATVGSGPAAAATAGTETVSA